MTEFIVIQTYTYCDTDFLYHGNTTIQSGSGMLHISLTAGSLLVSPMAQLQTTEWPKLVMYFSALYLQGRAHPWGGVGRGMTPCSMMKQVGCHWPRVPADSCYRAWPDKVVFLSQLLVFSSRTFDLVLLGNANNEEKKEQFLGVAMESRNGRFAVW